VEGESLVTLDCEVSSYDEGVEALLVETEEGCVSVDQPVLEVKLPASWSPQPKSLEGEVWPKSPETSFDVDSEAKPWAGRGGRVGVFGMATGSGLIGAEGVLFQSQSDCT